MFLFRLGKEKLSYNVTVSLLKLKYQPKDKLNSNQQIQIVVQRGSHRLEFLSQINKKGQIKVDKESQNFNMTLYYDKGDKVFEKKVMTIQGKILDEFNQTVTTLQKVEMDIAEYAEESGNTENNIQAQIYKQGSKKECCKVVLNIKIVKRDGCFTETDTLNSEQKPINKSKNKQGQKPTISRKKQVRTQNVQKSQEDITYSLKSKDKNSKKYQNTLQRIAKNKEVAERIRKGNEQTVRSHSINKFDFQQTSEDNETVEFNKKVPTPPRFKINQNPIQPSSLDLKLFETEKMLRQKNKQVLKLKKQLEIQKKISESLLNEQRNQQNANLSSLAMKEMQNLKTQLQVANMKLNGLETVNRKYGQQLDEAHEANQKQAQQIAYYKNMLQKEKVKMAQVFQMALQREDTDLISFLQELASQQ